MRALDNTELFQLLASLQKKCDKTVLFVCDICGESSTSTEFEAEEGFCPKCCEGKPTLPGRCSFCNASLKSLPETPHVTGRPCASIELFKKSSKIVVFDEVAQSSYREKVKNNLLELGFGLDQLEREGKDEFEALIKQALFADAQRFLSDVHATYEHLDLSFKPFKHLKRKIADAEHRYESAKDDFLTCLGNKDYVAAEQAWNSLNANFENVPEIANHKKILDERLNKLTDLHEEMNEDANAFFQKYKNDPSLSQYYSQETLNQLSDKLVNRISDDMRVRINALEARSESLLDVGGIFSGLKARWEVIALEQEIKELQTELRIVNEKYRFD